MKDRKQSRSVNQLTVDVPAGREEAFMLFVTEFLSGDTPQDREIRTRAAEENQGIASLRKLFQIAQGNSGQCRRIAQFLAGCYDPMRFPFDLGNLRPIDAELFADCLAVLHLYHRGVKDLHKYFVDGGQAWEKMIEMWGLSQESLNVAASQLSTYLEDSDSDELRQLGRKIAGLRFRSNRDSKE